MEWLISFTYIIYQYASLTPPPHTHTHTNTISVFGVELFVTKDNEVFLNEVAPRPHNTGHFTQDACVCSQFENHIRAVAGLPLGSTEMIVNSAAMVNVLGAPDGTYESTMKSIVRSYEVSEAERSGAKHPTLACGFNYSS